MRTERMRYVPGKISLLTAGIAALLILSGCAPARYPSYSYYDDTAGMDDVEYLSAYGEWIYLPAYGTVWSPDVVFGWQPFYHGHWVRTIDGWTWVSYEPYGWLVYHYGFWGYRPDIGWFWVPGDTWYPATVDWYTFGGYTAWAPLPPPGISWVDPWDPYDVDVWVVVDIDDFTSENIGRYRVERPIYKERIDRRTVYERAPSTSEVEEATRKRVPIVKIQEQQEYMRHREIPERPVSDDRTDRRPPAADEGEKKELKRIVLPRVERRKVERHAPRVEKEVLKRQRSREAESDRSGDKRERTREKRESTDRREDTREKQDTTRDKQDATRDRGDATEDTRKRRK